MEFNATFLVSAFSFIIFTLVMNKLLYQPISDIIAKRQAYLDENYAVTKTNLENVELIKTDKEKQISKSRAEAKDMISQEVETLKVKKEQLELEKKEEMLKKVQSEKHSIAKEKEQAEVEISSSLEDISDSIVSKLIGGDS